MSNTAINLLIIFAILSHAYLVPIKAFSSEAQRSEATVRGSEDKTCKTYLRNPSPEVKLPIVVYFPGTGIYSTSGEDMFIPPIEMVLKDKMAMILTIDKPGITGDQESPDGYSFDESIYFRYTQRDLVTCGINAIKQITTENSEQFSGNIILVGHSEGAQISVRILSRLMKSNSILKKNIKALLLSGSPMKDWKKILKDQLSVEELSDLLSAYEKKDDSTVRQMVESFGYIYLQDIFTTPPLIQTLRDLWDSKPDAIFSFYHGIKDENTLVQPVWDFEEANIQRQREKKSFLKLQARYYQADHYLNLSTMDDMSMFLKANL